MHDNLYSSDDPPRQWPETADEALHLALSERERFLRRHPHMRTYQEEIDQVLDKSGNHRGRLDVLGILMQGKLLEMHRELDSLIEIVQHTIESDQI